MVYGNTCDMMNVANVFAKKSANIFKISIQKDFDKKWNYDVYMYIESGLLELFLT